MANGIVIGLASKKTAPFSQYRQAEETPVFVSQYSVMLSRRSSRVRAMSSVPCRPFDEPGLAGAVAVVQHECRQVGG